MKNNKYIFLNLKDFINILLDLLRNNEEFVNNSILENKDSFSLLKDSFDLVFKELKKCKYTNEIKDKYLYKYISNESKHLHALFKGKISMVDHDQFDDIFDCVDLNNISNRTRILCLSQKNNIGSLWGTYANKFNGFCFKYSLLDIVDKIAESTGYKISLILGNEIIYGKIETIFPEIFIKLNKNVNLCKFFSKLISCFKKDFTWRYQKEYRLIAFSDNTFSKTFTDFNIVPLRYYYWDLKNKKMMSKKLS